MSSKVDNFLSKTLGKDFFESLEKFELWKPETKTTVDHEEIRTALQIVPRTIMALLIRELSPMNVGDNKIIPLSVGTNSTLNVTKHGRDTFSGDVLENNKKAVDFKYRTIPGIGLIIMSAFELYDMENLINSSNQKDLKEDSDKKVQQLIDDRLELHDLIGKVVDKKIMEKDAIQKLFLKKLSELREIARTSAPMSDEYFRGIANGVEVVHATANEVEPEFIEPIKKSSPVKKFLENRKKKTEFSVQLVKGEHIHCPDCGKDVFNGKEIHACICFGDPGKIFLKKTENGLVVKFGRNWDIENIEMLLDILRKK